MGIRKTHSSPQRAFFSKRRYPKAHPPRFPSDYHPADAKASPQEVTARGLRLQAVRWVLWHVGEGATKLVSEVQHSRDA